MTLKHTVLIFYVKNSFNGKSFRLLQIRSKKGEPIFAIDKALLGNKLSNKLNLDSSKEHWHYHRYPDIQNKKSKHRPYEGW